MRVNVEMLVCFVLLCAGFFFLGYGWSFYGPLYKTAGVLGICGVSALAVWVAGGEHHDQR